MLGKPVYSSQPDSYFLSWRQVPYGKPFGFLFSISRYRELFPNIGNLNSRYRETNFRYREIINFPISGKRFSDIGNWFSDIGKCVWFPDIGKSIPDIRKSPPDRSRSLRQPCSTALPRPLSTTAPSNTGPIGDCHYDFSKSQCLYIHICKTRSVQPTIIIQPIITFRNTEISGAELMSLMILTRTQHWDNWNYYM